MRLTGEQIRLRGLAALKKELGRAGMVRFLQHYENGSGDYTKERTELLKDLTINDLRRRVRSRKKKK